MASGRDGNAQLRRLLDGRDGAAIPYATVKVLNAPRGTVVSADGSFKLQVFPGDSILVTSVGYEEKIFTGFDFHDTILLEPKYKKLTEITIREKKFIRSLFAGNGAATVNANMDCEFYKGKKTTCLNWGPSGNEEEFAEKIALPSVTLTYQLRKIYLPVKKMGCYGPLLLRIYLPEKNGKYPGEILLVKPVAIQKNAVHDGKVMIDLSNENIYIENSSSLFLSLGWLPRAASEDCITTLVFPLANSTENTFTRSVVSNSFLWQPMGLVESKTKELHAKLVSFYAVELWEMR